MAQKSIQINTRLAGMIKNRRQELNLTIEQAAQKAGVGTKTWCRYEAGEAIRHDKYKGVCKALNWLQLPAEDEDREGIHIEDYKSHEAWSRFLAEHFGELAALSFAIGSDILLDRIEEDMQELAKMPKGTHIGQTGSYLADMLPEQFLMNYDYEFFYLLYCELNRLRGIAGAGGEMIAHSVLEELILKLVVEEAEFLMEEAIDGEEDEDWKEWIYDLFEDADIEMYLYSGMYLRESQKYHFSNWQKHQFF